MRGRLYGQKGFTLIELSIVLVIIGIILAAVLKGQDLITNARTKQFTTTLQSWQIAANNFLDLTKRLPGDENNNGIIGDGPSDYVSTDMATLANPPVNQFTIGVNNYTVFLGNNFDGTSTYKNILLVCVSTDCTGKFNPEAIKMAGFFASTTDNQDDVRGPYAGGNANSSVYAITANTGTLDLPHETVKNESITPAGAGTNGSYSWLARPITNGVTDVTGLVYILH